MEKPIEYPLEYFFGYVVHVHSYTEYMCVYIYTHLMEHHLDYPVKIRKRPPTYDTPRMTCITLPNGHHVQYTI